MGDKPNDQTIMDKSMRSVFGKPAHICNNKNHNLTHQLVCAPTVGNIPYEATEEKLKEIFNEVGPVLSLK